MAVNTREMWSSEIKIAFFSKKFFSKVFFPKITPAAGGFAPRPP